MAQSCEHCGKSGWNYARGLCRKCWERPETRKKYAKSKYAVNPSQYRSGIVRKPTVLALAIPGSEDKIRMLEARVAAREELFHPMDFAGDLS